MNRKSLLIVSAFLVLVAATPTFAGPGIHLGASIDPDDFLIGVRFKSHPIEEYFTIVPNVEVGFGDITMIAGNLDGHYNFKTSSEYKPYIGAGFTINWFDPDEGDSNTEVGGSILGACLAWDAALRGLKVALVERGELGGATSANSLRIIHGGLRYLVRGDLRRMRESIRERSALLRIAPGLVQPFPVAIPAAFPAIPTDGPSPRPGPQRFPFRRTQSPPRSKSASTRGTGALRGRADRPLSGTRSPGPGGGSPMV